MAYAAPTGAITVSNATPKVGQPTTLTFTITSSGTVDCTLTGIEIFWLTPKGAPGISSTPTCANSQTAGAGSNPTGKTIPNGSTLAVSWDAKLFHAEAATMNAVATAVRNDTGAVITIPGASAVTITAS